MGLNLAWHLRCAGALLILLGVAHARFGRYLHWERDLRKLSVVNRQIFLVHCFYIALFLVMMGAVLLFLTKSLLEPTPLARAILGGGALVWSVRLYIQWFVFERSLWRGNPFNRRVHFLLTTLWVYFSAVNGIGFERALR